MIVVTKTEEFNQIKRDLVDRIEKLEHVTGNAWTDLAVIKEQLTSFRERIDRHGNNQEKMYADVTRYMEKIDSIITGNESPGLVSKVLLLEEDRKESKQNGYIAKTAGVGLALKVLYDVFFHAK